jgi:hypothetical protein
VTVHPRDIDRPANRIHADACEPPERTPAEMLNVLSRIVNRKVEQLKTITRDGTVDLGPEYDDELDRTLDRVVKLVRNKELTDEELLAEHDRQNPKEGDE